MFAADWTVMVRVDPAGNTFCAVEVAALSFHRITADALVDRAFEVLLDQRLRLDKPCWINKLVQVDI